MGMCMGVGVGVECGVWSVERVCKRARVPACVCRLHRIGLPRHRNASRWERILDVISSHLTDCYHPVNAISYIVQSLALKGSHAADRQRSGVSVWTLLLWCTAGVARTETHYRTVHARSTHSCALPQP